MDHQLYPNKVLAFEIENQLLSKLAMNRFIKVDNSLVGVPGDTVEVHTYYATDGNVEELEMGEGNTKAIAAKLSDKDYKIKLAQVRTHWYDEEKMLDPKAVQVAVNHVSTELVNHFNLDIAKEFKKATRTAPSTGFSFDTFVDAVAMLSDTEEDPSAVNTFAWITPKIAAEIRKNSKDYLQYVESFIRTGYVGTLGGVHLYTTNWAYDISVDPATNRFKYAEPSEIIVGRSGAVTLFNKKGTEVEREREANTRENWLYSRKYYAAALTDDTQVVKIAAAAETP